MSGKEASPSEVQDEFFARLRALDDTIAPAVNKHDRVIVLIEACLDEGIDTRSEIVRLLRQLGFNYRHVALTLAKETGDNPECFRWRQDERGCYKQHDEQD